MKKKKNLPGELERIDNNILYGENYFSYHLHLKFSLLVITRRQQGTIMFKEKTKQKKEKEKKLTMWIYSMWINCLGEDLSPPQKRQWIKVQTR